MKPHYQTDREAYEAGLAEGERLRDLAELRAAIEVAVSNCSGNVVASVGGGISMGEGEGS